MASSINPRVRRLNQKLRINCRDELPNDFAYGKPTSSYRNKIQSDRNPDER